MSLDTELGVLTGRLADGTVSAVELTAAALDRVRRTEAVLGAFRVLRAEQAMAEAAEADRRLAAGERGPLLGVPIAVKDDLDLAGLPTAFGCAGEFPVATADSTEIGLIRAAGAVIIGKTNAPELGQWPFTEGHFGQTRNPWSPGHTPGGSSGGSAAAVAGGVVPVAVGSDGAGSLRIPAGWTNLVAIKPEAGTIVVPGADPMHGISTTGPLARTVTDAAVLLDVLAGHDRPVFAAAAGRDPGRLRIAVSVKPPFTTYRSRLDDRVRARVLALAEALAGLGHEVFEAEPAYGLIGLNFLARSTAGLTEAGNRVPDHALLDPRTRENLRNGRLLGRPLAGFGRASSGHFARRVGRIFGSADVVLAPTTAVPPPAIGEWWELGTRALGKAMVTACPYAWPWNALGWPAIGVPAGFTAEGLPVGAQLLGPAGSTERLIALAGRLEESVRWSELRPDDARVLLQ